MKGHTMKVEKSGQSGTVAVPNFQGRIQGSAFFGSLGKRIADDKYGIGREIPKRSPETTHKYDTQVFATRLS